MNLSDGNFTAYLVAGAVVMTSVFSSTFASASYYRDRDSGVIRMLLVSPHDVRTLLLGKSLAGLVIGCMQALVVLLIAAPFVDFRWQYGVIPGVLLAIGTIALLNLFLSGIAQVLASRIQTMQGFHLVMNLALFPLLFFSGAFFPIDDLPGWLRVLALANPLTYAVDALQLAIYTGAGDSYLGLTIDIPLLGTLAVVVYAFGASRIPRLTWSGQ
jgi:ABC-2 type transport system permease protein